MLISAYIQTVKWLLIMIIVHGKSAVSVTLSQAAQLTGAVEYTDWISAQD